jgi:hypothetical protein
MRFSQRKCSSREVLQLTKGFALDIRLLRNGLGRRLPEEVRSQGLKE